jgi:DNA-binding CsgD family transcriptional regulator
VRAKTLGAPEDAGRAGGVSFELKLPTRQTECLQLVAEGATSAEIGRILGLSTRTVDHYIRFACAKLGVRSRAQAVAVATDLKLIRVSRAD